MSLCCGWCWHQPQTASHIHIRHYKAFEHIDMMLSIDIHWQPYTVMLTPLAGNVGDMSPRQPNVGTFGWHLTVVATQNRSRHSILVSGIANICPFLLIATAVNNVPPSPSPLPPRWHWPHPRALVCSCSCRPHPLLPPLTTTPITAVDNCHRHCHSGQQQPPKASGCRLPSTVAMTIIVVCSGGRWRWRRWHLCHCRQCRRQDGGQPPVAAAIAAAAADAAATTPLPLPPLSLSLQPSPTSSPLLRPCWW